MNEEQLRKWHDSVCEAMCRYDCDTIDEVFEKGYKKGGSDMEKAKQIIIDKLQEQIPKWHIVADGDLPSDDEYLNSKLCWDEYRERCVFARFVNGSWIMGNGDESIKVIAWMELPKFREVE